MNVINIILLVIYAFIYSVKNYNSIFLIILSFFTITVLFGKILLNNKPIYSKKNIILSFFVSIFISLFTIGSITFSYKLDKISILNTSDKPITVEGIYLNEKLTKTNYPYSKKYDYINDASIKTEYKLYNKIDESYKMTLYPNKIYDFNVNKIKKIQIDFQKANKNISIYINNKKYVINSYSYDKNKKINKIYDSSYKYYFSNINNNNINTIIIAFVFLIYIYFSIIIRAINDKKSIIYLLSILLIEFNQVINISFFSKIIFILLIFFLTNKKNNIIISKKYIPLIVLSSMYISFSFIGDRIINQKFSLRIITIYLICFFLIYLLFPYFINIIEYLKAFIKNKNNKKETKIFKHRISVFIITFLICLFYQFIFSPYIIHTDTYMEILDIINNKFSNWHPYFHILMMKSFYIIFGKLEYFLYFRFIIYSLLLNSILFYFQKKGLRIKFIYFISIFITIFPITGIMLVTLVKDIDFSIALVALTFYLFLIIKDYDFFRKNRLNYIYLTFSLFLVGVLRHNGIYIVIISVIFLLFLIIKYKKYMLYISIFLTFVLIFTIKIPLYQILNVEDSPKNFDIAPLMHGFCYLIVENKEIDKKIVDYLDEKVMSKENIIKHYDKYNIDLFLHYTEDNVRNKNIDKTKILKMYLKQFISTPFLLIKDRLYGSDMLWNVSEKDNVRVYKYQIKYDEFDTDYSESLDIKENYNEVLSSVINWLLVFISNNEFLNLLFFRTGIYIDLLIILLNYCILKKKNEGLASIPIIINIITLFIAMGHQEYRYVWMIELVVFELYFMFFNYQSDNT